MNETNKQTEIVLAAIEKHPDMDIEELIKKISPKEKLLKEKLLTKLLWFSQNSRIIVSIALSLLMTVCISSIYNNIQDIRSFRRHPLFLSYN